jgi:hypothetical protein
MTLQLMVNIYGESYTLVVTPESFTLVPLGKRGTRQRIELPWTAFVDEDIAKLSGLHASMKRIRASRPRE